MYIYLTTTGTRAGNTVSTANNIDHATLEGGMVTRVSKTRNPLSANGQDSSGDVLLCIHAYGWSHSTNNIIHSTQADTHRQMTTVGKR